MRSDLLEYDNEKWIICRERQRERDKKGMECVVTQRGKSENHPFSFVYRTSKVLGQFNLLNTWLLLDYHFKRMA